MPRRSFSDGSRGDERLVRQRPAGFHDHGGAPLFDSGIEAGHVLRHLTPQHCRLQAPKLGRLLEQPVFRGVG